MAVIQTSDGRSAKIEIVDGKVVKTNVPAKPKPAA